MQAVLNTNEMIVGAVSGDMAIRSQSNMLFATGGNTERMRIDSAGRVGIGSSDPQSVLHSSAPKPTYTDSGVVFRGSTTNNNSHSGISLMSAGNALTGSIGSNYLVDGTTISQTNTSRSSGYIQFNNTTIAGITSDIIFGGLVKGSTTQVERMRITSGGLVGIGGTPSTDSVARLRPSTCPARCARLRPLQSEGTRT